jgi:hypothetical protein
VADGAEGEQQKYGIDMAQCLRVQCSASFSSSASHELQLYFDYFIFRIQNCARPWTETADRRLT